MARIIDLVTNAGQVDVTKGIVEEAVKSCPEMQFFDADIVPGTTIATLARTSLPTATPCAFRALTTPRATRSPRATTPSNENPSSRQLLTRCSASSRLVSRCGPSSTRFLSSTMPCSSR